MAIRMREQESFRLELTPMIDVVFLLLVFFLIATTFQQREREVRVAVPPSESSQQVGKGSDPLVVNVLDGGRIVVAGNSLDLEQLYAVVAERVARTPETKALIRGDRLLTYEEVVAVLDVCRRARATVSLATLEKSPR